MWINFNIGCYRENLDGYKLQRLTLGNRIKLKTVNCKVSRHRCGFRKYSSNFTVRER